MMCSFNAIRGVPACANHRAIQTWAREQWGFEGYVVSDQGAAYGILADHKYGNSLAEAAALAVKGGLDLEDANDAQHTAFSGITDAIKGGLLSGSWLSLSDTCVEWMTAEADVDASVRRLMYVRMKTGRTTKKRQE